jgi:hypothetical protein
LTAWDLSRLRYTVRKLTGKFDVNQLPDSSPLPGQVSVQNPPGVDDYINDFYLYDLPEDLRSLKLRDFYTFFTVPNCGTYSLPQSVYEVYDPIYIDNYQFRWYQYPQEFYQVWPELNFIDQNLFQGDGSTVTFTFQLTQTPVQQGTVVIGMIPNIDGSPSPYLETFRDTDQPIPLDIPVKQYFVNPGTLTGNFGGTGQIDYLTGAGSITFNVPPANGTYCSAHYHPYVASRPRDIMYWQDQLFIRPIPNDTYLVKVMAYMMPTAVLSAASNATVFPSTVVAPGTTQGSSPAYDTVTINGFSGSPQNPAGMTNVPDLNELWQVISYGAAIKILIEEGDWQEVEPLQAMYERQKMLAQRKTLKQLAHQRIPTVYSSNGARSDTWPIYPMS